MSIPLKKCIIVDDEPAAHYVLVNYISKNPNLELVAQLYNGIETLSYLRNNHIDLMFLDIDMPEITGLELLQTLTHQPHTILTTAYSEFALESYEYGVIDYLLKPIYYPRFIKAIERFLSLSIKEPKNQIPEYIEIKVNGENITLALDDIYYIQSYGNYVKIFTNNKILLTAITTQQLLQLLPESHFIRVHKSYIVAIDKIENCEKEQIIMNKTTIPLGITYRRDLHNKIAQRDYKL